MLAVHDKAADDEVFTAWLQIIEEAASDPLIFVKKAENSGLRYVGKRNPNLNRLATKRAHRIADEELKPARWFATNVLRQLES